MIDSLIEALPLLERFGGWVVVTVLMWVFGREFMALARSFNASVTSELRGLNSKLGTMIHTMERHENRLDNIAQTLDHIHGQMSTEVRAYHARNNHHNDQERTDDAC